MPEPETTQARHPRGHANHMAATLRAARQEQGRTLSQAAAKLQLSVPDLADLERQDDGATVGDVHAMARLRVYARELGLDPERMLTAALQAQGNEGGAVPTSDRPASAGEASGAPGSTGAPLPPPPSEPEVGRPRVSAVALLATLGVVVAIGTAAAAVVMSSQPPLDVTLTSPASDETAEDSQAGASSQAGGSSQQSAAGSEVTAEDVGERAALSADGDGEGTGGVSVGKQGTASHPSADVGADSALEEELDTEAADGEADPELPAARPPEETAVQVLDGAGDPEALDEAVATLEEHGYVVATVNATSDRYEESAVFASDGWEEEAEALAGRDERFVVGGENPGFSDEIPLHVVVGEAWSG